MTNASPSNISDPFSKPSDLAAHVFKYLKERQNISERITPEILVHLFEVLYYTSMKTEEGDSVKVNIVFIDPNTRNESAEADFSSDSWDLILFGEEKKFDVKNLLKLAKAADPWTGSIAVYIDENNQLNIYGMVDMAISSMSFINHENEYKPERAGIFQASIIGIGSISVMYRFDLIATLKQNILVTRFLDVLASGEVSDRIKKGTLKSRSILTERISSFLKLEPIMWETYYDNLWKDTISRLLIQIVNYHHGGAFLITDEIRGINIKYRLNYSRLANAVANVTYTAAAQEYTKLEIEKKNQSDNSTYSDIYINQQDFKSAKDELKGAIRFVASSSCVDGLVLFNPEMETLGFGAVIQEVSPPEKIYFSQDPEGSETKLKEGEPKDLGTRHQSMISFCDRHSDALGFVVSQDGDIRAIARVNEKLVVWENIQTQKHIKVLKHQPPGTKYAYHRISKRL